jgi:hypothetical protein
VPIYVTALRYLRLKPRLRWLNRRLKPVLQGRGAGSHTLPNHMSGSGLYVSGMEEVRPVAMLLATVGCINLV